MTKWSANSVPSTTTLSMPAPPSIDTGALTLYWTWFSPAPVRISVSAAVEKPLVSRGIATRPARSRQTMSQSAAGSAVAGSQSVPVPPFVFVCASANARTRNWSLPSSPSSRSGAWLA